MSQPRHFIDLCDVDAATLRGILDHARKLKAARPEGQAALDEGAPCAGRMLAMIFEKPSTRTRVSFDVGMRQLGGQTVVLNAGDLHLARGETLADTARVMSRYVDAIMVRTSRHEFVEELASHASVPVINGLTDASHPCQLMADVMTYEEHRGSAKGRTFAWLGDGNNVARSAIHAAGRFGFDLRLACPAERRGGLDSALDWASREDVDVTVTADPVEAVDGADCVITDTWVSMGDEDAGTRRAQLEAYRVDEALMAKAAPDALFMHCLPAHRGEEVTDGVIDGPWSVVWDEAENRLHAQKGILAWCLG